MRPRFVAVLLILLSLPLPAAAAEWSEVLARAGREEKAVVVLFRPDRCTACAYVENTLLRHPAVERRLEKVVFVMQDFEGEAAKEWQSRRPGLGLFDHSGKLRARWELIPSDATTLSTILDNAAGAAPHLARAVELSKAGPHEGELELALALTKIGYYKEARAAVERAIEHGSPATRQLGIAGRAMLDLTAGKEGRARTALEALTREAVSPDVASTAWMCLATLDRLAGRTAEAIAAYEKAIALGGAESENGQNATKMIAALRQSAATRAVGTIELVPMSDQLITGRRTVRTLVQSAAVARVVFSVDGTPRATADRPPFSATIDFGQVPQTQSIRAVAHDAGGREIGTAEMVVNNAGEMFWLRIVEPREGPAAGTVRVSANLRTPVGQKVRRVVLWWNDAERAVLTNAPWQANVKVPEAEVGVLRAVAELEDGRTAEDAVLLNGIGFSEHTYVPLVELPVTIRGGPVKPAEIVVREGKKRRTVEAVVAGTEAPLTVGLLIDTSTSMQTSLADVQEAAIGFLDNALEAKDRAFLIAFDSSARLVQPPTDDRARLRERILTLHANGDTSLYDAMILGLLQFEGVRGRRALVVFSDGMDRTSRYQNNDVAELARRSNIPIFVISSVPKTIGAQWTIVLHDLTRVSESTGGRLHRIHDLSALPGVYAQIEADLRAQSLIVIRTEPGKTENDWRRIDLAVTGRKDVRAPEGYFAPW